MALLIWAGSIWKVFELTALLIWLSRAARPESADDVFWSREARFDSCRVSEEVCRPDTFEDRPCAASLMELVRPVVWLGMRSVNPCSLIFI